MVDLRPRLVTDNCFLGVKPLIILQSYLGYENSEQNLKLKLREGKVIALWYGYYEIGSPLEEWNRIQKKAAADPYLLTKITSPPPYGCFYFLLPLGPGGNLFTDQRV